MTRLRDTDRSTRRPSAADSHVRRLPEQRTGFREWISDPGGKISFAIVALFFFMVWAACLFSGVILSAFLGITSGWKVFLVANGMFGVLLLGWAFLGGSRKLLLMEGGLLEVAARLASPPREKPLELDEAPALLARRRGRPDEALRLYRGWVQEFPHRLDLRFQIAEIDQLDRGDAAAALRGYRDFLRRLEGAERDPSAAEAGCAELARSRVTDLSREAKAPPPRRQIKLQ